MVETFPRRYGYAPARTRRRQEVGDLTYGAYACTGLLTDQLAAGLPLAEVQREAERTLAFVRNAKFGLMIDCVTTQVQLVRALRGLTPSLSCFSDADLDERRFEAELESNPSRALSLCWYWVRKLQVLVLSGDFTAALAAAEKAQPLLWTSPALIEVAEYHFYAALARAGHCAAASGMERGHHLELLRGHRDQLAIWAASCPENFSDREALVAAEAARVDGDGPAAMRLYEQAIRSARDNGFIHNEALANELAARFYEERGFETISHAYLRNARYGYLRWGADGKVRQLDQLYRHLWEEERAPSPTSTIGAPVDQLDLATVIKVSQAISGEIVLDKLLDTLMRTAIEQAGAERGVLVLSRGADPRIAAEANTSGDAIVVQLHDGPATAVALPESILHYVVRSNETVILDDAVAQSPFTADPYIRQHHTRSILCLPLLNRGHLTGVLYLENNLAPRVFAPARIVVLKLLASQGAIALENTRLYEDLAGREARIRRLVDANIIGIFIFDADVGILDANDAFLGVVGYDRGDLVSGALNWWELTPPEWRDASDHALRKVTRTGTAQPFEKEYFRKDGSRVPVLVAGASFEEGGRQGVGFVLDLTERKRAEAAVRQSEKELRDVVETIPAIVWTALPDGRLDYANRRWQEFSGLTLDETLGWKWTTTAPYHPDDLRRLVSKWNAALATGQPFETRARRAAEGEYRWLFQSVVPLRDEHGRILKWYGVIADIEDRMRAEEALQQAQAELAHVNRVTTMGQMTASIAHEVAQPIAAALTNASAGLRWLSSDPHNAENARRAFSRIIENAEHARNILDGIRALARKAPPRQDRFDLNDAILDVIALSRSAVQKHGVSLQTELAPDLPAVSGDRVQLQQVILNLILNAGEAMSGLDEGTREVLVSTKADASCEVGVTVRDTGPGLEPQAAARVFEAFYTTKPEGLGMGLAICHSIIEAHGGRLWASANEPRGAVFQFTLPSTQDVVAPAEHVGSVPEA